MSAYGRKRDESPYFKAPFEPYAGPMMPKYPCKLMETRCCMIVSKDSKGEVVATEYKAGQCEKVCERFDKELP